MLDEVTAFGMFFFLAAIELGNRAMVSHDTGPDFAGLAFTVIELGGVLHGGARFGVMRLG